MPLGMTDESNQFVVILGAGASADSDLPIMAHFGDRARRLYFENKKLGNDPGMQECFETAFSFQAECERSNRVFKKDWENIEELYTQADLRRIAQTSGGISEDKLCNDIAWVIWDVYRRGLPRVGADHYAQSLAEYLNLQMSNGIVPAIITTNYDLIIEAALKAKNVPFLHAGFVFPPSPLTGPLELFPESRPGSMVATGGAVEIIKLHGSAHWFEVNGKWFASRNVDHAPTSFSVVNPTVTRDRVIAAVAQVDTTPGPHLIKPGIVAPMIGKASVGSAIAAQWRRAIAVCSRARTVLVVGYSFPETDTFMTRLLVEGLHQNEDLHSMIICDRRPIEQWVAKLRSMFGPVFREKKLWFAQLKAPNVYEKLNQRGADLAGLRSAAELVN